MAGWRVRHQQRSLVVAQFTNSQRNAKTIKQDGHGYGLYSAIDKPMKSTYSASYQGDIRAIHRQVRQLGSQSVYIQHSPLSESNRSLPKLV